MQNSRRLLALDAARGLAVIGMYIQHFALNQRNSFVSGNTMILFILCSGISYTLMGRSMERRNTEPAIFRARVLARSVFLDFAGYLLLMLNTPFAVVMQAYAMLFLIAMVLIRRQTCTLVIVSAVGFFLCPPLMLAGMSLFQGSALLADIAGGPLSALAWLPVFAAGMVIGRLDLSRKNTAAGMAAAGAAILAAFKTFTVTVLPKIYESFCSWQAQFADTLYAASDPYAVWPKNTQAPLWQMLFIDAPQGGSTFELLIGLGGSLILLALLLLIEKRWTLPLQPFAGAGRAALSLYSIQFLAAWVIMLLGGDPTQLGSVIPLGDIVIAAAVLVAGWGISLLPMGPLEWAVRWFEGLFIAGGSSPRTEASSTRRLRRENVTRK